MYTSHQIADFFLSKYGDEGEITPMKLNKLVYISHGWYLGYFGKPLTSEMPQAWMYGPVYKSLYHNYKSFGGNPIKGVFKDVVKLSNQTDEEFLSAIWNSYGRFDGGQLGNLTHQKGTPWSKTWESIKSNGSKNLDIPVSVIHEYYNKILRDRGLDPNKFAEKK